MLARQCANEKWKERAWEIKNVFSIDFKIVNRVAIDVSFRQSVPDSRSWASESKLHESRHLVWLTQSPDGWSQITAVLSVLDEAMMVWWRQHAANLKRQQSYFVLNSLLNRQPVQRSQQWTGIGLSWHLENDPSCIVFHPLQLLDTAAWGTVQHSIAVVNLRQDQANVCASSVVGICR